MNMKNLLTIFIVLGIFGTCVSAASAADVHDINGVEMSDEMVEWYFGIDLVDECVMSDDLYDGYGDDFDVDDDDESWYDIYTKTLDRD